MSESNHLSVMVEQVVRLLRPEGCELIVDCTAGLGGHAEAILSAAGRQGRLIGIDVDESLLKRAKKRLEVFGERVRLFRANFSQLVEVLDQSAEGKVDLVLADLGVASAQLDDPARGLSFMADGPLDMRLDLRLTRTAADIVNTMDRTQLADLIYAYGEERFSRRIAGAIVAARRTRRIARSLELAEIVSKALPPAVRAKRRGVHPATRTFQALRISVNEELTNLEILLNSLPRVLKPNGRAAVISFHSLEDRRVKHAFADLVRSGQGRLLNPKPITPDAEEIKLNPRSRSAKLRGIEMLISGSSDGAKDHDQRNTDRAVGGTGVHRDVRPGADGADRN